MFKYIVASLILTTSSFAQTISDLSPNSSVRELDDPRNRFVLENLTDKSASPWCIDGKNWDTESNIEITLNSKSKVQSVFVANGFYDPKLFSMNARPSKMVLKSNSGEVREIVLKDVHSVQKYDFPTMTTDTIELSFPEIKNGSKFQDICFSEISFESINDAGLLQKQKAEKSRADQILKKEMVFKNPNESAEDFFTILNNGNKYSIRPNPKKNKFIILYNMFEPMTLILDPLPKVTLIPIKSLYDKISLEIDGNCESMNKKENCKIYFNPADSSFKVYRKKALIFNSSRPEDFQ